jgi:hypothetical protein
MGFVIIYTTKPEKDKTGPRLGCPRNYIGREFCHNFLLPYYRTSVGIGVEYRHFQGFPERGGFFGEIPEFHGISCAELQSSMLL